MGCTLCFCGDRPRISDGHSTKYMARFKFCWLDPKRFKDFTPPFRILEHQNVAKNKNTRRA
jgi:hypothetical protein